MHFSQYLLNNRQLTFLSSLEHEFNFERDKNYLFDLSYLSSLAILGERAAEFLQGQLSCDLHQVTTNMMQQGAMCNLKGRVLALMDVINGHGLLQLILPSDLMAATQFSLNKTAMLTRVKLEPTTSYHFYGLWIRNKNDLMPNNIHLSESLHSFTETKEACCYALNPHFYIMLIKKNHINTLIQPFIDNQRLRGSLAWHQLQLRNKNLQIYPATRGLFLPHRMDLHLSGYLSFDKGCYKGQEIVARTHYRAKLKHELKLFTVETNEPPIAGKKLYDLSGRTEIGELIDYSPLTSNHYLIAASILKEHPNQAMIESHSHEKNPVLLNPVN